MNGGFRRVVALIPLMIGADRPAKEILSPVAITIFGGLISSTLGWIILPDPPSCSCAMAWLSLERLVDAAKADNPKKTEPSSAAVQTY